MNPRVISSKKWTALPAELCIQISEVFKSGFEDEAGRGQFIVEGRIYPEELLFRVGFLEKGRLRQKNVEISLNFNPNKQNALELIHFAVDCAASMMQEVLSDEEAWDDLPHEWKEVKMDNREVFVQVSSVNSNLESEADRLLGELDEDLIHGEDDEELKKTAISMLGLSGDENESEEEMLESVRTKVKGSKKKDEVH